MALLTIWRYRDLAEAQIAKGKLLSAGIEAELADDNLVRTNWLWSDAVGGIRLKVPQEDADRAIEILAEPIPEYLSVDSQVFMQPRCPVCGSLDVTHESIDKGITFGSWLVLGFPVRKRADYWRCESCDARWEWHDPGDEPKMIPATIFVATGNTGKLRDFAGAAAAIPTIEIAGLPEFSELPKVEETGSTFAENARLKSEFYSTFVPGQIVLSDDSGLEVDALGGAPGVHSARYAAKGAENASDSDNNYKLLGEMARLPGAPRTARFVCVISAARDGKELASFRGTAEGEILASPIGREGFGYDPLFYFPPLGKTFGELSPEEKAKYSHRGAAFGHFLEWYSGGLKPTS